ncbi:uncharacterized protein F4812DRAFT_467472 [Daldinia caldariorum]|uniref:uncharacterized protein n=1 Tax=Daldinia caldariorum TaxID=326644 RepID=UPI0020083B03|nr:uncharacterized protein F4812DRAFT_467472 [Daldinia caldariorum]KAI1471366.1 hypothetical protein F4812DRAFT_467472 [Daldinia caldariorum]
MSSKSPLLNHAISHLYEFIQLWPALGLTIKQEDIQYEPLYDGAPNLYFIIEHLHKSSVLLSPPHSPTARLNGIECLFRYQTNSSDIDKTDAGESRNCDVDTEDCAFKAALQYQVSDLTDDTSNSAVHDYYWEEPMLDSFADHSRQQWEDAGYLAQRALCVTIGIRKRMRGLRLFHLDTRPSLLELAPAIWNAHYLKVVACHAKTIPIISTILAKSSQHQSASVRQKGRKLLLEDVSRDKDCDSMETEVEPNAYLCSIQKRLWDLVQTTLKPTIQIKKTGIGVDTPRRENTNWPLMVMPPDMNLEGYENGDYFYMLDGSTDNDFNFEYPYQHLESLEPLDEECRNNFDVTPEYEQCYYENQNMIVLDEDALPGVIDKIEREPSHSPGSSPPDALPLRSSGILELRDASTIQQYLPDHFRNPIMDMDDLYTPDYAYDVADIYDDTDELPCNTGHMLWGMEQSMYNAEDDDPTIDEGAIDHDNDDNGERAGAQDIEMY